MAFKPVRTGKMTKTPKELLLEFVDLILVVFVAFLLIRFVVTPTRTPTESMVPTIAANDYTMINRVPYYFGDPKIGDIVVFHHERQRYMKRVIATPGDLVDMKDGDVYINDKLLDEPYLNEEHSTYAYLPLEDELPATMPKNRYFVMGDNRYYSEDSRDFGMVHRKAIYGKAWFHLWPPNRLGRVK